MIIQEAQKAHKNNNIKHLATTQELSIALFFFNEKILFQQYLTINNIRILLFKHESFALAYFIDKSYFFNAIQSF